MEVTQNTILKLIFRQGSDGDRKKVTLTSGEPGFATDTGRLFVGNGSLSGGLLVGNLFKGFTNDLSLIVAEVGDYAYHLDLHRLFVYAGPTNADWTQVGGVYLGSQYISIDEFNQITLNALSAGIFDVDALGNGLELDINGKISVTPSNITITEGLTASVNGVDVTGQAFSPLSGNIVIGMAPLSGVFTDSSVVFPLSVQAGKITIPTRMVAISSGLAGFIDDVDVTYTFFDPLTSNLIVKVGKISAFMIDPVALDGPLTINNGKISLSAKLPFDRISTRTVTISNNGSFQGLQAFDQFNNNITNQAVIPLSTDITIRMLPIAISAGMITSDALDGNIVLNSGRISLSTTIPFQFVSKTTLTVPQSSGLKLFVDNNTTPTTTPVNLLSANVILTSNDILARYDGLSGQVLRYSRNLLSVIRLSAGDYIFRYNAPTSEVYPNAIVYSALQLELLARPILFDLSACRVLILSANNFDAKRDANIIFRLTY